ncbi:hypothetical protein [Streptomyces sp. NPDC058701]|uniref:hypothetical protein n=1 Tax=Streptomyces sp. NPDC058701 TaxID=3346608 RepID=UPI0036537FFB
MPPADATYRVVVHGRGGPADAPRPAVDRVLTAAHAVTRLQAVVARETVPADLRR